MGNLQCKYTQMHHFVIFEFKVFSLQQAKTSHRQLHVHIVLSTIVNQDVSAVVTHSSIVCKKCFKLIDDIDSLEGQLINMKQVSAFIPIQREKMNR